MAEHQPVVVNPLTSSLAASVRDQINFADNSDDSNENVTYNTFVTDMDTNEIIPCHIEAVELPEYDSPVEEERQKSTNMDSNENIPNNMAEKVEKPEDTNDEKEHKISENTDMDTNENMPCNIESFCSIQLTEFEKDEKEPKESEDFDMASKLFFKWDF